MTERELRDGLRRIQAPDHAGAQERAWEVVRAVYGQTPAVRPARRRRRIAAVALAGVFAALTITLASAAAPRHTVARWLRQAVGAAPLPRAHPTLAGLPGGGQLLIDSNVGPWVVHPDGSRRHLGLFTGASWSPRALFAVAWHGSELAAVDPLGRARWALNRAGTVSVARWSPDGYRIAYIAAGSLRVVAGDGTGDHLLSARAGAVGPAWRPGVGSAHVLAFVDGRGELEVRNADTAAVLWRARIVGRPTQILWSADGRRLLIVAAHRLSLYSASGEPLGASDAGRVTTNGEAVFAPSGRRIAVVRHRSLPGGDSVDLLSASLRGRVLFSAAATLGDVGWSPDGRWLLVASPAADQWIFVRVTGGARLIAVSQIASQFDPGGRPPLAFPALAGWQP
jgi:hypothetical protein